MQRRAAAVYFALFVVLGAGAYGFIQVGVSEPTVDLGTPERSVDDTFDVGGRTYTVSNLSLTGGEGAGAMTGQLTWTNESNVETATLDNGSTTTYRGAEYNVSIENRTDVSAFTLRATQNVTAILQDDPDVENSTARIDGQRYVLFRDGSRQLLADYLPEPDTEGPFAVGDDYRLTTDDGNVTAEVASVTPGAATLSWVSPSEETFELSEGANLTLNGQAYFVHFPSDDTVQIASMDRWFDQYRQDLRVQDNWNERVAGLWGIVILGFMAAILLLAAAYMPVK